jgi:hypothetical protein
MKTSFVIYTDIKATVDKLSDEDAGKLFKLMIDFSNGIERTPDSFVLDLVFTPIKQQMIRDEFKWKEELEKRREAGRLGGIAKAQNSQNLASASDAKHSLADLSTTKQPLANLADNVTVSDTVIVTDIVNDTVIETTNIPSPSVSDSPVKGKHIFKKSPYHAIESFAESFIKTKCFQRYPSIDIELLHEDLCAASASNLALKYNNWVAAARNWVERNPNRYSKTPSEKTFSRSSKGIHL